MKKFFSTLFTALSVLVFATSCEGLSDYVIGGEGGTLVVELSKPAILPDGEDECKITVKYNGADVSGEAVLFSAADNTPVTVENMTYTSTVEGKFTFWAAYKDASTIGSPTTITVSSSANDGGEGGDVETGLAVTLSTSIIKANGVDSATVTVTYNGKVIPIDDPDLLFFDKITGKVIDNFDVYTTTTEGEFVFYVAYKTNNTKNAPTLIRAYNVDIPSRVADPKPSSTSFKHRSMLWQFTGTGCSKCPAMISAIKALMEDEGYASQVVHTAIHTYKSGDICNPINPSHRLWAGPGDFNDTFGVSGWPYMLVDAYLGASQSTAMIKDRVDRMLATPAKAGIAANVSIDGNILVIRATVKAAEAGPFRIGAWVLEDGIMADQEGAGVIAHENAVRIGDSKVSSYDVLGHKLGSLNKGDYADHLFVIDLSTTDSGGLGIMNRDNCHLVLFTVTTDSGTDTGTLYVTNAIDIPLANGEYTYDYE